MLLSSAEYTRLQLCLSGGLTGGFKQTLRGVQLSVAADTQPSEEEGPTGCLLPAVAEPLPDPTTASVSHVRAAASPMLNARL